MVVLESQVALYLSPTEMRNLHRAIKEVTDSYQTRVNGIQGAENEGIRGKMPLKRLKLINVVLQDEQKRLNTLQSLLYAIENTAWLYDIKLDESAIATVPATHLADNK